MARLGDVVTVSASTKKLDSEEIWLLNLDMIEQQTGYIISYNYVSADKLNGSIVQFDTENVLYSKLRPNLNKVVVPSQSGFATSEMLPLRPDTSILTREYLASYLRSESFVKWAVSKTAGAKMPRLGTKELLNKEIPVPTLEKQKYITKILEKIDNLISLHKQQLAKLDELVKARFVEMFGDLKQNTMNWPVCSFVDFAVIDTTMVHNFEEYADYPHIGIDSIEKETGNLTGYRSVKEDGVISGKYLFTPEHIIYSKIRPNLNKVALPNFVGVCSADAYPILPKKEICNRIFLAYTLRSPIFLDYILAFSNRTNLPKVNKQQVEGFCCPIPDWKLQERFASFVVQTNRHKLTIQQSLDKMEVLKKSLMQGYFGG